MADFDREKLSELIDQAGMDEAFFISNIHKMIAKGGMNMATGMKMLGELKGLSKRSEQKESNILDEFGIGTLMNSVQQNRRLKQNTENAVVIEEFDGHK